MISEKQRPIKADRKRINGRLCKLQTAVNSIQCAEQSIKNSFRFSSSRKMCVRFFYRTISIDDLCMCFCTNLPLTTMRVVAIVCSFGTHETHCRWDLIGGHLKKGKKIRVFALLSRSFIRRFRFRKFSVDACTPFFCRFNRWREIACCEFSISKLIYASVEQNNKKNNFCLFFLLLFLFICVLFHIQTNATLEMLCCLTTESRKQHRIKSKSTQFQTKITKTTLDRTVCNWRNAESVLEMKIVSFFPTLSN